MALTDNGQDPENIFSPLLVSISHAMHTETGHF